MPPTLYILVLVASPLDYARYRHTALHLDFGDKSPSPSENPSAESHIRSCTMEIVGLPGFFSFSERINADLPTQKTTLARAIPVGEILAPAPAVRAVVSRTPIPDTAGDWNSQNWVGDALARLVQAGYLDAGGGGRALDKMVDTVVEAGDEKIA
ncbi:hypothetical protein N7468_009266 [Penicillium chermesinum]|uniref:Uncharacterized protein n=1 Tax=Penicillium chermesinum TaxID=63820 RepID=A0A9W9NHG4_9EURO|nr:uncharacterized protein N7468_009266 [Penicillium chermesinum]KAJ5220062.1 hypothetical protein N7468_009266 [Penicillium chermesinum]